MRERSLILSLVSLLGLVVLLPAQGPVYRERWSYMQLERLRAEVWRELAGRGSGTKNRVGILLAEPDRGIPYLPTAKALAYVRGVEADAAFVLRATLAVFLLPEVVDPESTKEVCRSLNASLFLPYSVEIPGAIEFRATVRDTAGARVFETTVSRKTDLSNLRRARPVVKVPAAELADGQYTLEVRTFLDGKAPREKDQNLRLSFWVQRGYQRRAEAAMTAARELHEELDPLVRGQLLGVAAAVSRAYLGEAFHGQTDAVADLERLERAVENLREGRPVLAGIHGDVPVQIVMPSGELQAVVRLDEERHPATAAKAAARPLVVIAGGLPSYDPASRRPASPRTGLPRGLALAMPDFGRAEDFHVAFLESPGAGRDYNKALPAAIEALRELLAVRDQPVVLVCEREAASVVAFGIERLPASVRGLVFLGSGALTGPRIDKLGARPLRLGKLIDYPGGDGIDRVTAYAEQQRQKNADWPGDVALLGNARPPWPFGLPAWQQEILAFVREVTRD
ncbi:MAG: hypothetical protein NXI31_18845 [bacterium]|nr:hypothetical protein [bacterium]